MAGNKNSGRKILAVEIAKNQAIIKAWNKVSEDVDKFPTKEIALPIALKDMVNKVGNPDGSNIVIPIYGGNSIQGHPSNEKDILPEKENTCDIGGDISLKDH